jgi:mono/diheme cytochrome c family protein
VTTICDSEAWLRFLSSVRKKIGGFLCIGVVLVTTSSISTAQEPELGVEPNQAESTIPDVTVGKEIAGKLCVGCHVIEKTSSGNTQADVPSFPSIANRPNQSLEALTGWLMAPHAPMPDPHLTRKEIRDLAGYIVSLRGAP